MNRVTLLVSARDPAAGELPWPKPAYAWYVVIELIADPSIYFKIFDLFIVINEDMTLITDIS